MSKEEVGLSKESKREKKERKKEKKEKKERKEKKLEKEIASKDEESDEDESGSNDEEIAIDLNASVPLSKKQQRLLKKGKLNLDKLAKKNPPPKPILTEEEQAKEDKSKESKKSEFGVWIGNLSFDTTKEDLMRFIMGKTSTYNEDDNDGLLKIEETDFVRINIPKKDNKIKGFAYVDLPSDKHVATVISLSESHLNGRNLLIKNANSFEGRPQKDSNPLSKNPPSRILFVGNLSFDTTQDLLSEHFRHCGDIVKIRMATFEDTGKCKGFAFIDFRDESGPTTALKSKLAKKLINRPLRLEYGEDRSKLTPKKFARNQDENNTPNDLYSQPQPQSQPQPAASRERVKPQSFQTKRKFNSQESSSNKRQKSSVALATAQRASAAIVPSSGKKTTFD